MKNPAIHYSLTLENYIRNQTPNKSLAQYDATPFLISFLDKYGIYMEFPFRNENILGHSFTDEQGSSTMINKNITDPQRKFFTQAHELGHHLFDKELLCQNSMMEIMQTTDLTIDSFVEHRANVFAAHLLLPDDVLNAVMIERHSRKQVKNEQHVSYQTLQYRLEEFMRDKFFLKKNLSTLAVEDFMACAPGKCSTSPLSMFWQQAMLIHPSNDGRPLDVINEEILLHYLSPDILADRKRKQKQRELTKIWKNSDSSSQTLYGLTADAIDNQDDYYSQNIAF